MSVISDQNVLALGAVLFGLAWLGFWIDTTALGKKTSGVVWVIAAAMVLSNYKLIPFSSPSYDFVGGTLVPLAIPLLLFKADLRKIFRESGPVMLTFAIASAATVAGAVIGYYLFDLGEIGPKVAGVYSGAWIGGAVNFIAVSQAVEMTPTEFSVSIGASSMVSNIALLLLVAIPSISWITRQLPEHVAATSEDGEGDESHESTTAFKLTHVTGAIALSFAICAVSSALSNWLSMSQYNILFITVLTLVIANLVPKTLHNLEGDFDLGMLFMYIFFAAVGAGTDVSFFFSAALILFAYGMFIIIAHLFIVLFAAKLLKVDVAEAIVASGACLVGPAVTAAIATSRGWRSLVTPGIMCGIFGYVIGTFIGVSITAMLT